MLWPVCTCNMQGTSQILKSTEELLQHCFSVPGSHTSVLAETLRLDLLAAFCCFRQTKCTPSACL